MSKGSLHRRPMQIAPEEFDQRWAETFRTGTRVLFTGQHFQLSAPRKGAGFIVERIGDRKSVV